MKRFFSFILAMTLVSLSSFAGDLLTAAMFHEWSSSGADATVTSETTYCEYLINDAAASGGTVYGNGNVTAKTFADITEYAKLVLAFTEGTPRLLFNRSEDTSSDFIEIKSADSPYVTVGEDGTWTIDITKINAERGFAHLLCIKGANWANVLITRAELFTDGFSDGDYYFYNAEANAWLGGGNSWGTQASFVKHPWVFGVAVVDGGEGFTIDSYTYNNASDHFFARDAGDSGFYVDAPAAAWTFEKTDGGYYIKNAAGQYAAYDGTTILAVETEPTSNAVWQIFSKADLLDYFADATHALQADATFLLPVANFDRNHAVGWNGSRVSPWLVSVDCTNKNLSGGNNLNNCAESYHSPFDIYQELTDVPNGYYKVTLQGFYRQDGSDTDNLPYFYANDVKGYIGLKTGAENSMSQASESFSNGLYQQETITVQVTDGNLRIGVKNEGNANLWVIWDNFEVYYCGTEPAPTFPVTQLTEEAVMENWTITSTNTFHRNTWSGEADESGMKTPFIEAWVGTGNKLADATISHTPITGLTPGEYQVKLFARAFNEGNTTDYPSGITFFANDTKVDFVAVGTQSIYNNASTVLYTTFDATCQVGEDGTLNIGFELKDVVGDWLAFKNLEVIYMDPVIPTVTPVTAKQSAATEAAQKEAVDAFNAKPTPATYEAAKAAIAASQKSADFYAPYAMAIESLDEAGAAVFAASDVAAAYNAGTVDESDPTALKAATLSAQLVQTTPGSSLSFAGGTDKASWTNATGTYDYAIERYNGSAYTGTPEAPTKVIYQTISGLVPGATYEVQYLATANMAWIGAATGAGIAQLYANDVTVDIDVLDQVSCQPSDYPRTIQAKADADGNFQFGIQNIGTGGNWYVVQFTDLTLIEAPAPIAEFVEVDVVIESELGAYYEGIAKDVTDQLELIELAIGCKASEAEIAVVLPDGTYDTNYQLGGTDGWRNAEGAWQTWGDAAYFYVKADFSLESAQLYSIGGYPGKTDSPVTYKTTYSFKNGANEGLLHVSLVYPAAPEPEIPVAPYPYEFNEESSQTLAVTRTLGLGYTAQTATYDAAKVCETLGIASIGKAKIYGINASVAWDIDEDVEWIDKAMNTYDGWRDLNGDFCKWGENAAVCVKCTLADADNITICTYPGQEPSATAPDYNAYWVLAANNKAVLIDTQIKFVEADSEEATAITSVESKAETVKVYDLTGRKVNALKPGQIYIINGKKVMMK